MITKDVQCKTKTIKLLKARKYLLNTRSTFLDMYCRKLSEEGCGRNPFVQKSSGLFFHQKQSKVDPSVSRPLYAGENALN